MQKSITTFRSKFFVSQYQKTSLGNTSVYQKISGIEKFYASERGVSRFSVEKFLSHCTEIFHWRTLWCFRKILLSKNFMHRRGGASRFCRFFLSHRTKTKNFVKEPFCFPENFWYRKNLWIRGGISQFSVEIFMSHSAKNFREGILLFLRKFMVSKSFMDEKGVSRFSVEKFWSHSAEKFCGHPFNVSENLGYRKILCIIGGITIFRRKFFVSQCRKTS